MGSVLSDNNNRLILLSVIQLSGEHCITESNAIQRGMSERHIKALSRTGALIFPFYFFNEKRRKSRCQLRFRRERRGPRQDGPRKLRADRHHHQQRRNPSRSDDRQDVG